MAEHYPQYQKIKKEIQRAVRYNYIIPKKFSKVKFYLEHTFPVVATGRLLFPH